MIFVISLDTVKDLQQINELKYCSVCSNSRICFIIPRNKKDNVGFARINYDRHSYPSCLRARLVARLPQSGDDGAFRSSVSKVATVLGFRQVQRPPEGYQLTCLGAERHSRIQRHKKLDNNEYLEAKYHRQVVGVVSYQTKHV